MRRRRSEQEPQKTPEQKQREALMKAFNRAVYEVGADADVNKSESNARAAFKMADEIISIENGQIPQEIETGLIKAMNKAANWVGVTYATASGGAERYADVVVMISEKIVSLKKGQTPTP